MKITKLTTFIVPPRWCFLKVETDQGVTGWGEPVVEGRAHTVAAAVEELSDYLIGKDPRNIEDIWTVLYRGGFYRGGAVHMSALAGIDQALWDIKGKALGVSVSDLLGGQVRDKIRVYSWIGGDRPADTARAAKEAVARGFTAVKMNGTEELQFVDSFEKVDLALALHCPLGPIALAACLQLDAVCYNAFIQEQSLGIHYNESNDLLDYVRDPGVFDYDQGFVKIPNGPGLGIEINEEYVIERAAIGHRWRNPIWRHADGSFAEW